MYPFLNKAGFYDEELLPPSPKPQLGDHPPSAVRECFLDVFASALHIGYCSSLRNLKTRHAVVTGTNES